jgi:hypothetical protein
MWNHGRYDAHVDPRQRQAPARQQTQHVTAFSMSNAVQGQLMDTWFQQLTAQRAAAGLPPPVPQYHMPNYPSTATGFTSALAQSGVFVEDLALIITPPPGVKEHINVPGSPRDMRIITHFGGVSSDMLFDGFSTGGVVIASPPFGDNNPTCTVAVDGLLSIRLKYPVNFQHGQHVAWAPPPVVPGGAGAVHAFNPDPSGIDPRPTPVLVRIPMAGPLGFSPWGLESANFQPNDPVGPARFSEVLQASSAFFAPAAPAVPAAAGAGAAAAGAAAGVAAIAGGGGAAAFLPGAAPLRTTIALWSAGIQNVWRGGLGAWAAAPPAAPAAGAGVVAAAGAAAARRNESGLIDLGALERALATVPQASPALLVLRGAPAAAGGAAAAAAGAMVNTMAQRDLAIAVCTDALYAAWSRLLLDRKIGRFESSGGAGDTVMLRVF